MTNSYYVTLLVLFSIVAYMCLVDSNVAELILLFPKLLYVQVSRLWYMIRIYPRLRYDMFMLSRRRGKISKSHLDMAKQLLDEKNET